MLISPASTCLSKVTAMLCCRYVTLTLGEEQCLGLSQKLVVKLRQINRIAMGLRDREAGLAVQLDSVALGVEEIHAKGIPMADDALHV